MPKTKFDKPKYPPINNLRAAILERKFAAKLTWDDIAAAAHITPTTMRGLFSRKPPEEWPSDVRNAVCRYLDIKVMQTIVDASAEKHGYL